jgi:hypothetical protein
MAFGRQRETIVGIGNARFNARVRRFTGIEHTLALTTDPNAPEQARSLHPVGQLQARLRDLAGRRRA